MGDDGTNAKRDSSQSKLEAIVIPTICLNDDDESEEDPTTIQAVRTACRETGFFYLTGHGVSTDLTESVLAQSRAFFELPVAEKQAVADPTLTRGYTALREEQLDATSSSSIGSGGDTKEGFYISVNDIAVTDARYNPAKLAGPNQWPTAALCPSLTDPIAFRTILTEYLTAVTRVANRVVRLLAASLGLDSHAFDDAFVHSDPMATLRLLHYEPTVSDVAAGLFGCGAHTDYGMITLLLTDHHEGLQIYYNKNSEKTDDNNDTGVWIPVPPKPHCLIVNLGDMLERWTNGMYRSTLHRVVIHKNDGGDRYSVPFFFEPSFDTVVECLPQCCNATHNPPRYPPTTSGQHLLEKYKSTHADFTPTTAS